MQTLIYINTIFISSHLQTSNNSLTIQHNYHIRQQKDCDVGGWSQTAGWKSEKSLKKMLINTFMDTLISMYHFLYLILEFVIHPQIRKSWDIL